MFTEGREGREDFPSRRCGKEAAFARQTRFTADAAHELRTPVAVILTHAQASLADAELSKEQREAFASVERAEQRMRRMIESLLQLARLDAGTEGRPRKPLDLRKAVGHLRPLARLRNVTLTTQFDSAKVRGDAVTLGQVVTNLVSNAIQHGREIGTVRVTVRNAEDGAVVEVADDGPGIATADAARVFDRFYRADAARTASGSTGLGLAISRAIAEAHGGTIAVQSQVGEGAIFTVCLPGRPTLGRRSNS